MGDAACRQAGIIPFIVLLLLTAVSANFAMYTLFRATEIVKAEQAAAADPSGKAEQKTVDDADAELTNPSQHGASEPLLNNSEDIHDEHEHEINYPIMGRILLGWWGEQLGSWSVTLQQIGACIAYIVIVADVLTEVLKLSIPSLKRYEVQLVTGRKESNPGLFPKKC